MSKIKINEIESLSSNGDLDLTPNGTGAVEIKSDETDGVLQLNSSANSSKVKITSPPSTAAQDYTLILPDNNIDANKYLSVKSVTGSGSTAVGQLEYASVTTPSINLDASEVTVGTLDTARLPSPLPATAGLGLAHVATYTVNSSIHEFDITGLDADSIYRFVVSHWGYSGNGTRATMWFLDASGTPYNYASSPAAYYDCINWYSFGYNPSFYNTRVQNSDIQIDGDQYGNNNYALGFIGDLITGTTANPEAGGVHIKALRNYNSSAYNGYTNAVLYPGTKNEIRGFRLRNSIGYQFNYGLQVRLYKYMED